VQVSPPHRGYAALYFWGPKAREADKKINNVYVEDSLPESVGHSVCSIHGQRGRS